MIASSGSSTVPCTVAPVGAAGAAGVAGGCCALDTRVNEGRRSNTRKATQVRKDILTPKNFQEKYRWQQCWRRSFRTAATAANIHRKVHAAIGIGGQNRIHPRTHSK